MFFTNEWTKGHQSVCPYLLQVRARNSEASASWSSRFELIADEEEG